jgi:hypothetical protein
MNSRNFAPALIQQQLEILEVIRQFADATMETVDLTLTLETRAQELLQQQLPDEAPLPEIKVAVRHLITAGFLIAKWIKSEMAAGPDADRQLRAAKNNAGQAGELLNALAVDRPSIKSMMEARVAIDTVIAIKDGLAALSAIGAIQLPLILSTSSRPVNMFTRKAKGEPEFVERPVVLSVLLYLEKELWANPQIIKPNYQYKIKGEIQLNVWPDGFTKLSLLPISTNDDSYYVLSIPAVKPFAGTQTIEGTLLFKYAQANFEEHWSLKLLAMLESADAAPIYPEIVGYDELKVKVLSETSFPMLTRFPSLNEKILQVLSEVDAIMPKLPTQEREDFALLLSRILNYQGHCAERGTYKGVGDLTEGQFRDRLIDFLDADTQLTSSIIKEGELAGGRVEINYKGITAELKVEKHESNREKVMEAHWRQAVTYGSSIGKHLTILCVLDLTVKTRPSATPANNVFLREPEFHGFEDNKPENPSRIVIVFIDGNLKRPSSL